MWGGNKEVVLKLMNADYPNLRVKINQNKIYFMYIGMVEGEKLGIYSYISPRFSEYQAESKWI